MRLSSVVVMALSTVAAALVFAHEGHEHKVMGTVQAVHGATHLEMRTEEGKTVSVALDGTTRYLRGTTAVKLADVQPGTRVVVSTVEQGKVMRAKEVRMATGESAGAGNVRPMLAAYEVVARALSEDDLAAAKTGAAQLAERATASGVPGVQAHALELARSDSLEDARQHFKTISLEVIAVAGREEGYRVMTCPMAEAHWMQSEATVANPYMGKSMSTCGKTKS